MPKSLAFLTLNYRCFFTFIRLVSNFVALKADLFLALLGIMWVLATKNTIEFFSFIHTISSNMTIFLAVPTFLCNIVLNKIPKSLFMHFVVKLDFTFSLIYWWTISRFITFDFFCLRLTWISILAFFINFFLIVSISFQKL